MDFTQGLDIRLNTPENVELLNQMRIKRLHFAWDNPKENLVPRFEKFTSQYKRKDPSRKIVYVLTNFWSTMEEDLYRVYTLRELGYDPYIMIYDKPNAPREIRWLQRWVNNKAIFRSCPNFEDYKP